ncbi:MAG: zinc metallopeptidase [Oscillospiraceae bacterium]|nr:zinc metallopeptidase [Oscillospiraceae bacterium]
MYLPFYYGIDYYFLILCVPALIFSLAVQIALKGTYRKQSKVLGDRQLTGAQAAYNVLRHYGITDVRVEPARGTLSDHYDPRSKVIRLSQGVYSSTSVAAVGIAAHEAGHAAQHAESWMPIKLRNAILPVVNIGNYLGVPLVVLGAMMSFGPLITLGLALFSGIVIFQLLTLPVEFNASRRALRVIDEQGMLGGQELKGAKKVLRAAALTYVAALVSSIATLLRLLLRFRRRN